MKTSDIVVGNDYAMGKSDWASRVRVLETGILQRTGWNRAVKDGVRVQFLTHEGDPIPDRPERTKLSRDITRTWEEHSELVRQRLETRDEMQRLDQVAIDRAAFLGEQLRVVGLNAAGHHEWRDMPDTIVTVGRYGETEVRIKGDDVGRLFKLLDLHDHQ